MILINPIRIKVNPIDCVGSSCEEIVDMFGSEEDKARIAEIVNDKNLKGLFETDNSGTYLVLGIDYSMRLKDLHETIESIGR